VLIFKDKNLKLYVNSITYELTGEKFYDKDRTTLGQEFCPWLFINNDESKADLIPITLVIENPSGGF